jgi:hypothetical protein
MKKLHHYLALVFGAVFILFAVVQYNDSDPWLWMPIYGLAAVVSLGVFQNRVPQRAFFPACVAYLAGAAWYFPAQWEGLGLDNMAMKTTNVELGREALGLAVCGLVMLYYHFATKK